MVEIHPQFIHKNGKPQFVVLPYEEFLDVKKALARQIEQGLVDPRFGGVWDNLTAEELAERQNVTKVETIQNFRWPYGPEDWEGFEEAVQEWRQNSGVNEKTHE
jgi:hypothetical protein